MCQGGGGNGVVQNVLKVERGRGGHAGLTISIVLWHFSVFTEAFVKALVVFSKKLGFVS